MSTRLVAVPSEMPGGLDAARSSHFGQTPAFTLVELDDGAIDASHIIENIGPDGGPAHGYAAVLLEQAGVTDVVTSHMGEGMKRKLDTAGIRIWWEDRAPDVRGAVEAFVAGEAEPLRDEHVQACGGGHHGASS